jgi:hypothetical protein
MISRRISRLVKEAIIAKKPGYSLSRSFLIEKVKFGCSQLLNHGINAAGIAHPRNLFFRVSAQSSRRDINDGKAANSESQQ